MKTCIVITAMAGLAVSGVAHAAPVVLRGQGVSGAPANLTVAPTPAFSSKFAVSEVDGRLSINGSQTAGAGSEHKLGSLKQVNDVRWAFTLSHSPSSGFTVTMSGILNGERDTLSRSIRWDGRTDHSTSNSLGSAQQSRTSFNALQLTASVPHHLDAAGLSFSQLVFSSASLGNGSFDAESLGSGGSAYTNTWMTFGNDPDLAAHSWSLSGVVLGSRKVSADLGSLNFGIVGQTVVVVPLPPAAWAGLSTMAGIAGIGFIRRRRQLA